MATDFALGGASPRQPRAFLENTYQQELDALAAAGGPRQRFFTVFWLMMGIFPVVMSGTTPSVAVPAMRAWFHISHLEAQVVASVFLDGMTVGMLLSGGWNGSVGVRSAFRLILGVFMAASVVASVRLHRDGGGAGGAGRRGGRGPGAGEDDGDAVYPPQERGRAMAVYGYGMFLSPIAGPFVGASSTAGWASGASSSSRCRSARCRAGAARGGFRAMRHPTCGDRCACCLRCCFAVSSSA